MSLVMKHIHAFVVGMLGCWLDNGLQEPTEEIARFAEELLLKVTALPATSPETNA